MDPSEAARILLSIQDTVACTSSGKSPLCQLTPEQLSEVRASRKRTGPEALARKYAVAVDALRELQSLALKGIKDMPTFQLNLEPLDDGRKPEPSQLGHPEKAADVPSKKPKGSTLNLEVVPYVPTAPPKSVVPGETAATTWAFVSNCWSSYLAFFQKSVAWRMYVLLFKWSMRALLYFPLVLMWVALIYGVLLMLLIISHPETLVSAAFQALGLAPRYAAWAGHQMLQQLETELVSRFR